ncbi:Alpha-glucosidase AglA [Candidatus Rhodobacter oscarellae]|uniref:Alpha-glucosidase AglA n=1 Tax=Candidatus Rhodobacter oscarellae TaxID=1675527 RepID=A0A0J9E3T5_9RHOB|nr:Alpha-glucosidase AglA [Candidatus Rhodobacter lobularis]
MNEMVQMSVKAGKSTDPDWWRGAVIYQIYPRSYQDSNGDGIGDLPGIIQRLPYVASLGVDAIWISPFFTSPMLDFGYDVSDYCDVDQMFGTLSDFDQLIARAHELGLKVLIDLVLSHTSDRHDWFAESRRSRENARADWYVWADPKPDGTPPNNWLSIFGGPAWEWDGERMQYYLHNFLKEQPDLNLHNPAVQDALLGVVRFWLERGVDGFRLDTINFYFHDPELRDNPALSPEDRNASIAPAVNPYNWQDHLYDKNRPENLEFLKRFRAVLEEFPGATAVGEVGDSQRGAEIQAEYSSGGDKVQMCYSFDFLSGDSLTGTRVQEVVDRFETLSQDGWACWSFSNHDVVRHATRWGLSEAALRVHAALLLTLRGSVCLYQGEELGLTEAEVGFEDLQDPYGIRFWPEFKGRDGCRTPMVWQQDNRNAGFSEGSTWLPVAPEHLARAAAAQEGDAASTLAWYRNMLAFRARHLVLAKGDVEITEARDGFLSLIRRHEGQRIFAAFNLGADPQPMTLPQGRWVQDQSAPFSATHTTELAAHQAWFGVEEG